MTTPIDGNVLVVRDGDYVEALYYCHLYEDVLDLINEGLLFAKQRGYENTNLSIMKLEDNKLKALTLEEYPNYEEFALILNPHVLPCCQTCGTLNFIYANENKCFCPACKDFK